jgi:hypothetical protein
MMTELEDFEWWWSRWVAATQIPSLVNLEWLKNVMRHAYMTGAANEWDHSE